VRPGDRDESLRLERQLAQYEAREGRLPGIAAQSGRRALIEQLLDSERRNRYVKVLLGRDLGPRTGDPATSAFDPLRAAIINYRQGDRDEAFWLIFLFVHFGKHRRAEWRYAREVYGKLGQGGRWDWNSVSANVGQFRSWLDENSAQIKGVDGPRGFGNHRKYESLGGWTDNGTGAVVSSYVAWVEQAGSHDRLIQDAIARAHGDETAAFDILYRSMGAVHRFGRTARFDYLSMIGKVEFAAIKPGKTYMAGATGPRLGARLLFGASDSVDSSELEAHLNTLEEYLSVGFVALEDALCNWQKSPTLFKPFRG
jgi:hypothetical protein